MSSDRGWLLLATALGFVLACGSSSSTPDAAPSDAELADAYAGPVDYRLTVSAVPDRDGFRDAGIVVTVDDAVVENPEGSVVVMRTFGDYDEAKEASFTVESWFGDVLLYRRVESPGFCAGGCAGSVDNPTFEAMTLCVTTSGELPINSTSCAYLGDGSCHGDFFCQWDCAPLRTGSCPEGKKCGLVVTVLEPLFAFFACVQEGTVPVDGACSRGELGPETGYDDCAEGSVCWEGACRAFCSESVPCASGQCEPIPRMASNPGWCQ